MKSNYVDVDFIRMMLAILPEEQHEELIEKHIKAIEDND